MAVTANMRTERADSFFYQTCYCRKYKPEVSSGLDLGTEETGRKGRLFFRLIGPCCYLVPDFDNHLRVLTDKSAKEHEIRMLHLCALRPLYTHTAWSVGIGLISALVNLLGTLEGDLQMGGVE